MKKSILAFAAIIACLSISAQYNKKITDRLATVISETKDNEFIEAVVVMKDQYPINELDKKLHLQNASLDDRAYTVITELRIHAEITQKDILNYLYSLSEDKILYLKNFWITNLMCITTHPDVLNELSRFSDIAYIDIDEPAKLIEPIEKKPAGKGYGYAEQNLKIVNAHKMWAAGYTGDGVIVANLDTGVDGDHPALHWNWHGNNVPWEQAWFDGFEGTAYPVDLEGSQEQAGHGTATMGVMVGLDHNMHDTIGMAFNAEWIACRALFGTGNTSQRIECMEWIIDPDGNPSTIDDMPIVFNNSWGHYNYGCTTPYDVALLAIEAAGIAIVWAAGNIGPAPSTIAQPANQNHSEILAFSVGGIDHVDPELTIFSWSSRGPTPCNLGTGNNIKPEISAPIYCRTSYLNFEYFTMVGTSFAAPHVSGAIALLKEALPGKTGPELLWMLYGSALDRGIPGEDNSYGMGVLDVWAAYVYQPSPEDPRRPMSVTAYSDYTTPNSVELTWLDPNQMIGGQLLDNFEIRIIRDGSLVGNVSSGSEFFEDGGLTDEQMYEYEIITVDLNTDSMSIPVFKSVYAGGSPYPGSPLNLSYSFTGSSIELNWDDPIIQSDGSPIDDLDKVYVFRNGILIDSVSKGIEEYFDYPPLETTVRYYLIAADQEIPPNLSDPSETVPCFVGDYPRVLVWVGPDTKFESRFSGDSIFNLLAELNIPSFISDDLFEFGTELDSLDAIFTVLGCYPWPHILSQSSQEASSLEIYLYNGGNLYLEGGHSFTPDSWWPNPYNIHPWFGLSGSNMGSGDVNGINGHDFISNFSFDYLGHNELMNELFPASATIIWKNSQNEDISGVYYDGFGVGKAIGVVPSFGGLLDNDSCTKKDLLCRYLDLFGIEYDSTLSQVEKLTVKTNLSSFLIYPNPVYTKCNISYSLAKEEFISIKVYDIYGNENKIIKSEYNPAGIHHIEWNTERFPTGIYFIRIESDSLSEVLKVIKTK